MDVTVEEMETTGTDCQLLKHHTNQHKQENKEYISDNTSSMDYIRKLAGKIEIVVTLSQVNNKHKRKQLMGSSISCCCCCTDDIYMTSSSRKKRALQLDSMIDDLNAEYTIMMDDHTDKDYDDDDDY